MPRPKKQADNSNDELRAVGTGENKFNRQKALTLLPDVKATERKRIKEGWRWMPTHKGFVLTKPKAA